MSERRPSRPRIGDPVVVQGVKFRIQRVRNGRFVAKKTFGPETVERDVADLVYDPRVDVWRWQP